MYFNPHTREGCDPQTADVYHAPYISIHTPVKGVTFLPGGSVCPAVYFNPHTREGCDIIKDIITGTAFQISIHTPVKGVTIKNGA